MMITIKCPHCGGLLEYSQEVFDRAAEASLAAVERAMTAREQEQEGHHTITFHVGPCASTYPAASPERGEPT